MININSKVFIAGHNGMLGSSILRRLKKEGTQKKITIDKKKLDLRNQNLVRKFFKNSKPDAVIMRLQKLEVLGPILNIQQTLLVICKFKQI